MVIQQKIEENSSTIIIRTRHLARYLPAALMDLSQQIFIIVLVVMTGQFKLLTTARQQQNIQEYLKTGLGHLGGASLM